GPFFWSGWQWNPSRAIDTMWVNNLQAVGCSAYNNGLIVQVTLFDPWDPAWANSPFNPANSVGLNQGFTSQQYFASFDQPPPATADVLGDQNDIARGRQVAALTAVVNGLKAYPNIIWQIANEPDLNSPAAVSNVAWWEATMAAKVRALDSTHLIMLNGHTASTFS